MSRILCSVAVGLTAVAFGVASGCGGDDPARPAQGGEGGAGGEQGSEAGNASVAGASEGGAGGVESSTGGATAGGASGEVVDGCEAATGPGTDVPSGITADEVWTWERSPYRISATTYLTATLTLEPCTVVELDGDAGILIGNDPEAGELIAHGDSMTNAAGQTERREIYFRRLTSDAAWGSLTVDTTGNLDLALVRLDGGGSAASGQSGGGTILAYGGSPEGEPNPNVLLQDVTIAGSESYGVNLQSQAAFAAASDGLTVESSGAESVYPIYLEAGVAFSLPTHLRLEGNERDEVLVHPFGRLASDTFPARGVPLVLDSQLYVATPIDEPGTATLTIEAGVELRFGVGAGSGIMFGADGTHPGTLVAVGTASAPIWFHASEAAPEPASWMGLYFAYTTVSGNQLEHAIIEDAGAFSGAQGYGCGPGENDASILILNDTAVEPFIQNCEFKNAGGDTQILLGWTDSTDQVAEAQAFVDTNSFSDAPACHVSEPRATAPECPGNTDPDCL